MTAHQIMMKSVQSADQAKLVAFFGEGANQYNQAVNQLIAVNQQRDEIVKRYLRDHRHQWQSVVQTTHQAHKTDAA